MTTSEIKPCPFCGNTVAIRHYDFVDDAGWFWMECDDCHARGPRSREFIDPPPSSRWNRRSPASAPSGETVPCGCRACLADLDKSKPLDHGMPRAGTMLVVCRTCGNKRCPHATDHRHACTNSNEPGQAGSVYGGPPAPSGEGPSVPTLKDADAILTAWLAERDYKDGDLLTMIAEDPSSAAWLVLAGMKAAPRVSPALAAIVEEIDGLEKKATAGDWSVDDPRVVGPVAWDAIVRGPKMEPIFSANVAGWDKKTAKANRDLLVALRNNWPAIREAIKGVERG